MALPANFTNAEAITTSDTVDIATGAPAGLYVGGAGNAVIVLPGGEAVTFNGLVAGSVLYLRYKRVNATGTTATNLVALY